LRTEKHPSLIVSLEGGRYFTLQNPESLSVLQNPQRQVVLDELKARFNVRSKARRLIRPKVDAHSWEELESIIDEWRESVEVIDHIEFYYRPGKANVFNVPAAADVKEDPSFQFKDVGGLVSDMIQIEDSTVDPPIHPISLELFVEDESGGRLVHILKVEINRSEARRAGLPGIKAITEAYREGSLGELMGDKSRTNPALEQLRRMDVDAEILESELDQIAEDAVKARVESHPFTFRTDEGSLLVAYDSPTLEGVIVKAPYDHIDFVFG